MTLIFKEKKKQIGNGLMNLIVWEKRYERN